jgi:hypothetical protein
VGIETAGTIVADAACELGLVAFTSKPSDPFGSADPNIGQLCQLLKPVGRTLVRLAQWSRLLQPYAFSTVANQGLYALPDDFDRMVPQTAWNRSTRQPLGGPLSPQEFEYFKGRLAGITWNILFRTLQGQFQAFPDDATPGGYVVAYEYISNYFVQAAGSSANLASPWGPGVTYAGNAIVSYGGNIYESQSGTGVSGTTGPHGSSGGGITDGTCTWTFLNSAGLAAPTQSSDTVLLDSHLVTRALKLQWLLQKGMPSDAALADYSLALEAAKAGDNPGAVLSLSRRTFSEPMLGLANLPLNGTAGQ